MNITPNEARWPKYAIKDAVDRRMITGAQLGVIAKSWWCEICQANRQSAIHRAHVAAESARRGQR